MNNLHFLEVRCFAEPLKDGQWQAFCVDLDLAAQAESLPAVREKLDAMISDYVNDAVVGEDREYCEQLLSRKAPLSLRAKYHFYYGLNRAVRALSLASDGIRQITFVERPSAPAPAGCH